MSIPLIETHNLKKYFKTKAGYLHAVDDINIQINKGETLGIVGESGCGKSTLGRTVLRLSAPTSGQILFDGKDITKYNHKQMKIAKSDMQIIFQDPFSSLDPRMIVFDLIAEPIKEILGIKNKKELETKVFKLMETVGLSDKLVNVYPHELDGGRRQRIGIARTLSIDPQFIVCDEPVSALDVSIQAQILNLLMDLQQERNLTYMFITHDLSVVKHISNKISVMYLGQIVETAMSEELFSNPLHPYTQALLAAIPRAKYYEKKKVREIIRGEVTSPIEPKPGCRFAPRCKYVKAECTLADIDYIEISKDHYVACVLHK
ncbi:MAG: ABC transporter ATP-binding protein [Eubacteriales bacterium]|nr:ABC transporter ATP-binding protein [Eubacteriales bacterium]